MTIPPVPERSARFAGENGLVTPTWDAFLRGLVRSLKSLDTQLTSQDTSKASATQPFSEAAFIEFPDDKDYVFLSLGIDGTITELVTKAASGSCTATVLVRDATGAETALSGGASSVTTTEDTVGQGSSKITASDGIIIRISDNSSSEGVSVTIRGTRTLD